MFLVLPDFIALLHAPPVVNVLEGWPFIAAEKQCCLHHLLYSFTVQHGAARTPCSDAAAAVTLIQADSKVLKMFRAMLNLMFTLPSNTEPKELKSADSTSHILIMLFPPCPCCFLNPSIMPFIFPCHHIKSFFPGNGRMYFHSRHLKPYHKKYVDGFTSLHKNVFFS